MPFQPLPRLSLPVVLLLFLTTVIAFEITGATGGVDPTTGARPSRHEISRFSKSGPPWSLFVLALYEIQRVNRWDPLSYFSIAGIHGYPMIPYDGVQGAGPYVGYCRHAAVPFSTWHRPYLALYEQAIWSRAQVLATTYPPALRDQYQAAALTLRIPYWDSALNPSLPSEVSNPIITITTPSGNTTLANPLYAYTFQSDAAGNGFPINFTMANFTSTVRWASDTKPTGNQSEANAALKANSVAVSQLTYQLFANIVNFTAFSCSAPGGQVNVANNVETIHNSIHNSVGGFGHMQFPEVAAFEPIFWLHHANVDRLLALWQAMNPDSWMVPTLNTFGSYYELPGTIDSGSTLLAPFHSDNATTMFTSDDVRSTARFSYTYPELPDWSMDPVLLKDHVRRQINRLYNPFLNPPPKRRMLRSPRRATNLATAFSRITVDEAKQLSVNNAERQWFAKIHLDRFAYRTNSALYFFMGEPPADVSSWPSASNLIGTQGQFINADVVAMHPEGIPTGALEGELPLTHTLVGGMHRGFIADLSPESVLEILRQGLQWRASTADGCEINCSLLSGLSISVGSRPVEPARDEACFPKYGDVEWHGTVTQGKVGGGKQYYRLAR